MSEFPRKRLVFWSCRANCTYAVQRLWSFFLSFNLKKNISCYLL